MDAYCAMTKATISSMPSVAIRAGRRPQDRAQVAFFRKSTAACVGSSLSCCCCCSSAIATRGLVMSFLSAAATSRWKLSRKDLRLRRGSVSVVSTVVSIERIDD